MKRLSSVVTEEVELEIVECDCGYHMGVDATYLDQVGDLVINCPVCQAVIDTNLVFPEEPEADDRFCPKCGFVYAAHNSDGSCVEES